MIDPDNSGGQADNRSSVTDELEQDAQGLKEAAIKHGEVQAEQGKERVAAAASSASAAVQTAADQLRENDDAPDWLASAFTTVARQVDSMASRLQDKSPRELANETRRFAADNPAAFLVASAAAGFAAARFLRAGAEYHQNDAGSQDGNDGMSKSSFTSGSADGEQALATTPTFGVSTQSTGGLS